MMPNLKKLALKELISRGCWRMKRTRQFHVMNAGIPVVVQKQT